MYRFTRNNKKNIQSLFEKRTGVTLNPQAAHNSVSLKKLAVMAAVLILSFSMLAFTYPIFSPLDGDQLYLMGQYEGEGIISIQVINGSDKKLEFQKQLKLMSWHSGEVAPLNGNVKFENTAFEPHSSGIMTVDLSQAYPMEELAQSAAANEYYLLLTNQDFLFGQDWICSFLYDSNLNIPEETASPVISAAAQTLSEIEESLRFYFEDHYLDEVPAWNPANVTYLEKVQELLREQNGYFVHSIDPLLILEAPEEDYPVMQNHFSLDSFNRIVASMFPGEGQDKALTLGIPIPQYEGQTDGGNGGFYVRYFFTYPTAELQQEKAYTFVYGRILDFDAMEDHKVYTDEQYTVYDMTHLFFTDLDAYIDDFTAAFGGDIYMDDDVRSRIHRLYDYYENRENLSFFYVQDEKK